MRVKGEISLRAAIPSLLPNDKQFCRTSIPFVAKNIKTIFKTNNKTCSKNVGGINSCSLGHMSDKAVSGIQV